MSRSDGWSVAFTLLAAGTAYFISGKYSAWGSIGIAVVIIVYLLFTKKTEQPPFTVSQKQEASPTLQSNPTQSVTVNLPPHPPARPAPRPASKPQPKPNLQVNTYRMANVDESVGDHDGFCFPDDQSEPNAAVACIKNKSTSEPGVYVSDVRATLTFRDEAGNEIGHAVNRACWVDNHLKNATFDLEESHCVILAVIHDGKCIAPYVKEEFAHFEMGISLEALIVNPVPSSVELILIANSNRVMEPKIFDLVQVDGKPTIKLRS
jgi:hypothetical protein